jgi:hypothetical protein
MVISVHSIARTEEDRREVLLSSTQSEPVTATVEKPYHNDLKIRLLAESYFQSSESVDSSEQVFEYQHKYKYQNNKNIFQGHLVLGGYQVNKSTYIAVPEFFYEYTADNMGGAAEGLADTPEAGDAGLVKKYSFGRKILDASEMDQHFNLGLINSYFTQDYMTYQNQGLTGFHQEFNATNWGLNVSVLPFYFPNQGPVIKEVNGQIIGSNRWVNKPPTRFAFNDANKEIIYSLNYNEIYQRIFSPGVLAQFRLGQVENGIHWVTSVSKRPLNEPVLERETFGDLDVVGKVNIVPTVVYSDIITTELRYKSQFFRSTISYMADRPQNKTARSFYSIQKLNSMSGYSVFTEYDFQFSSARSFTLGLATASFSGGEIVDLNSDGTENIFTFTKQRLQYKRPISVYVQADLFKIAGQPMRAKTQWLYDEEQQGSVFTSEFSYQALNSMSLRAGIHIIGTENQKTDDYGFLQSFQANDRFYGGLDYVF